MNPVLQFLKYKVYEAKVKSKSTGEEFASVIIVNKNTPIVKDETYMGSGKEDFIFISKRIT